MAPLRGEWTRLAAADAEVMQRRAAAHLHAHGVRTGNRVAIVARSSAELLATILGALRSAIIPVVLNAALTPLELAPLLEDCEPALVLDDRGVRAAAGEDEQMDLAPVPLGRPMHYTSGTTGRPKGVWSGVLDEAAAAALLREEQQLWNFRADDIQLVCSPLHHSAPIRFATGTLLAGGEVLLLERFDAVTAAAAIERERPTTMFCVPAHLRRLFALDTQPDFSSFRLVTHAGEACPTSVKLTAIDAFPRGSVWEFYGSTEAQFTACSTEEWLERPGTVGRARPGRELAVEDNGVIWCHVPDYARFEYWRDPAKTAAAWRDGWFTAGDLGHLDGDGYLYIDGRRDDLVISGGINVYPVEVEQAIEELDAVMAAAVFGVDDERWGQRVCAAVVGDVTPDAVLAHCAGRLAPYKRPKEVFVVDELPMTSTGKLQRLRLADLFGGDR